MLIPKLRGMLGLGVVIALAGCGLVSSDVTDFDLTLPDKNFTINIDGWKVDRSKAGDYLATDCSAAPPTACNAAVQQVCTMGCAGACNETSQTCDLSLEVSLAQMVNLVMEKPELQSVNDQSVLKVTVDSVTYEIISNTLNINTPEITIYVAPSSVTSVRTADASIKAIGILDPIAGGVGTTTAHSILFTPTGKADLANVMSSFKTPFNVLVGSSIVVTAGQPIPTGKLDAVFHIKGHAGL